MNTVQIQVHFFLSKTYIMLNEVQNLYIDTKNKRKAGLVHADIGLWSPGKFDQNKYTFKCAQFLNLSAGFLDDISTQHVYVFGFLK